MSELRYYKLFHRTSALTSPEFISVVEFGKDDEVYFKYEADKVIAYHKYKRCLAMARIAQDDWHLHNSFYAMGHQEFEKRKCEFYAKWHRRWLDLAEKFKPNKEADDGNN